MYLICDQCGYPHSVNIPENYILYLREEGDSHFIEGDNGSFLHSSLSEYCCL